VLSRAWYAIRVRPKFERRASGELLLRGFEPFLPTQQVRRQWSDRMKTLEMPLFPGYLFCRFRLLDRIGVLEAPGVIQILGIGETPVPVSDEEIGAIQTMVASRIHLTPWPYLHSGQRVRIRQGPLAGVDGIVARADDGKSRVVVSVTLLQRSVAAEIDRDWLGIAS
jgi:transcription termination/antitermination protein NusG